MTMVLANIGSKQFKYQRKNIGLFFLLQKIPKWFTNRCRNSLYVFLLPFDMWQNHIWEILKNGINALDYGQPVAVGESVFLLGYCLQSDIHSGSDQL